MKKIQIFEKFVSDRKSLDDWGQFLSRDKSMLSRAKILNACGLNRSVLYQNAQITMQLAQIESDLARKGLIKSKDETNLNSLADSSFGISELLPMIEEVEAILCAFSSEIELAKQSLTEFPLPR